MAQFFRNSCLWNLLVFGQSDHPGCCMNFAQSETCPQTILPAQAMFQSALRFGAAQEKTGWMRYPAANPNPAIPKKQQVQRHSSHVAQLCELKNNVQVIRSDSAYVYIHKFCHVLKHYLGAPIDLQIACCCLDDWSIMPRKRIECWMATINSRKSKAQRQPHELQANYWTNMPALHTAQ